MLNISPNTIKGAVHPEDFHSFDKVLDPRAARYLARWFGALMILVLILLFLPWTQNVRGTGNTIPLQPGQRPQSVNATIDGRIEAWFVNEGDTIQKGDTIAYFSEVKDAYFDPALIDRTISQREAKNSAAGAYQEKADALASQIRALRQALTIKQQEAENKVQQTSLKVAMDSMKNIAEQTALQIARTQFARWDTLYKQDIETQTKWEDKRNKMFEQEAKAGAALNQLAVSRQEYINAMLRRDNVRNEYLEKIAKAESDRQSALTSLFEAQGSIAKFDNQISNYEIRRDFRYLLAPQSGIVNQALRQGIGEVVKAGEPILTISPLQFLLGAEVYIRPIDLPLMQKGQKVRLEFDGWPALVFSGWPNASFGTFGGKIYAIEADISKDGKYRLLVMPDPEAEPWPELMRPGSGVRSFALLQDVPLWYEIWRQLNQFPPEFYKLDKLQKESKSLTK
ncbi:MAG: HlyD family efflux transporter periplasmic adaptor subunit [Bacteroidota bacterium]